jgi:hypothetical protein
MSKHAESQSRVTERLPAAGLELAYPPPPTAPGSFGGSAAHASAPGRTPAPVPTPDPRPSWLSFLKSLRRSR